MVETLTVVDSLLLEVVMVAIMLTVLQQMVFLSPIIIITERFVTLLVLEEQVQTAVVQVQLLQEEVTLIRAV